MPAAPSRSKLAPRERVRQCLAWQETDRPPVQTYLTPEMHRTLQKRLGADDVLAALEVDFRGVFPPYRGKRPPNNDPAIHYDWWGVGYKSVAHSAQGAYDEAVILSLAALETMDDVVHYPWWPSPDEFDYDHLLTQCRQHSGYALILGGAGIPDILNGVSRGRGMEQVMMDIGLRDEVGMAIIQKRCDLCYQIMRRCLEKTRGLVDILHIGEDTGNQNGRMFSPKDFAEVFQPELKRFIDLGHEFGVSVMLHSCGDTHEIQPTFIDIGLDILDAMQPEPKGMQPLEPLRKSTHGKLVYCGLISTQQTLPYGSEADCRAEARHRLDVIARGGGYIFSPAHCIQPDTPVENVLAIYEEALGRKLG